MSENCVLHFGKVRETTEFLVFISRMHLIISIISYKNLIWRNINCSEINLILFEALEKKII